mmetsp:Transcript_21486/g.18554  ORF Transcript_21486/g.18554 Transcript_21486/m.18554 type:complete len:101 (-) Transcript_21486:448-750(-)|eukprot:CAMPEP_0114592452 /NCGR_PEP_ID=MMETSP0125-20121206/14275_1 /TAXON_ID=485358 ORGANISM="Aristerostoma sp., Strain ATCC 50986" /NCGR_SAMPLE_ID=MMETSP0125 /ASSEMBLY_ACC=CAM_ASM_000245 /LENGTH=100 /DNA_ID=CAMNT_0001791103 /DNA_START=267 /DNA_END=569 /DNA_ORIENTATION=+
MMPVKDQMIRVMKEYDLGVNDRIICYGDDNIIGACRGFWMLKVFNFSNVSILNGTFGLYKSQKYPIEMGAPTWAENRRNRTDEDFKIKHVQPLVACMHEV